MENGVKTNGVAWASELAAKYGQKLAHTFLLHFNVNDYASGTVRVQDYLSQMLVRRDIVVRYDVASGLTFGGDEQKALFVKVLGLEAMGAGSLAAAMGLNQAVGGGLSAQEVELPRKAGEVFPLLGRLLRLEPQDVGGEVRMLRVAVILNQAEMLCPAGDPGHLQPEDRVAIASVTNWSQDMAIGQNGLIILVARNLGQVAESLRVSGSGIEAIMVPLPNEAERLVWLEAYVQESGQEVDMPLPQLARSTALLSLVNLEDVFLRAQYEGRPVDARLVKERKDAIVRSEFGDILELWEPQFGFDMVAGHEAAKAFFADVVKALQIGDPKAPLGALLMGPAGTGKTAIAEALAFESGFHCAKINPAKILGMYVGQSEQKLERTLLAIEALAPCILFIDEIDQKFQARSEGPKGSDVGGHQLGRLLEFLSDNSHRGRIFTLAATNRPDLLDAAFKRPGRFDVKIPLLPPAYTAERAVLVNVMLKKYGVTIGDKKGHKAIAVIAENTGGWTGAELEGLVLKAVQLARRAGRDNLVASDLETARALYIPSTADVEFMARLALAEVNDLEFVPESMRVQAAAAKKEAQASEGRRGGVREL